MGSLAGDLAVGVDVDDAGNAYVTGGTFSDHFPISDAVKTSKTSGLLDYEAFAMKIDATGSAIVYSTYLGGDEDSFGLGIAVDAAGNTYVVGTTGTFLFVSTASSAEGNHRGFMLS